MKIRLKNFRSIIDTKIIDLKPINILVGKNSSGKSSFLRFFPMMKQSYQERTNSPLLLFGNYVDFGNFEDISNSNGKFCLSFEISSERLKYQSYYTHRHLRTFFRTDSRNIIISYKFNESTGVSKTIGIEEIIFNIHNSNVVFKMDINTNKLDDILVNNKSYYKNIYKTFFTNGEFNFHIVDKKSGDQNRSQDFVKIIESDIKKIISENLKRNSTSNLVERIFRKSSYSGEDFLDNLKRNKQSVFFQKRMLKWEIDSKEYIEFQDLNFLHDVIGEYQHLINNYLKNVFLNTSYVAPIRASAERYYRTKQLAIDEVDSNGQNLAPFLASLRPGMLKNYQNWTLDNFDFGVEIQKTLGHQSILIFHKGESKKTNLSDMGFGYSQILPIITQMWYNLNREQFTNDLSTKLRINNNYERIITIEQPELHLHPEFQAKFASSLCKFIEFSKNEDLDIKFIIETHSDTIINKLGHEIVEGKIDEKDINILIFEKNKNHETKIETSFFDIDGNLKNWPFGFFNF